MAGKSYLTVITFWMFRNAHLKFGQYKFSLKFNQLKIFFNAYCMQFALLHFNPTYQWTTTDRSHNSHSIDIVVTLFNGALLREYKKQCFCWDLQTPRYC